MKTSELIRQLQQLVEKYGDAEIEVHDDELDSGDIWYDKAAGKMRIDTEEYWN